MIAVIGAGISGLTSALTLQRLGHKVILLDKGRSVGGRLATRYGNDSEGVRRYIDTAAHYIELKPETPQFNDLLTQTIHKQRNVGQVTGPRGINSVAKSLADQLENVNLLTSHKATSIVYNSSTKKFSIAAEAKGKVQSFEVDAVLCTAPVPQSIDLVQSFPKLVQTLQKAPTYYRCLLLLLWPRKTIGKDALRQPTSIDRIVIQSHIEANVEPYPIAVHASYEWSDAHYKLEDEKIKAMLVEETGILEADYDIVQLKRWGQAQPKRKGPFELGFVRDGDCPLFVCSDALHLGNINGAGEAGIEAATALSDALNSQTHKL